MYISLQLVCYCWCSTANRYRSP